MSNHCWLRIPAPLRIRWPYVDLCGLLVPVLEVVVVAAVDVVLVDVFTDGDDANDEV